MINYIFYQKKGISQKKFQLLKKYIYIESEISLFNKKMENKKDLKKIKYTILKVVNSV